MVGALYALLTVLLLTTWRGQRIGIYLIVATLMSTAWGVSLASQAASGNLNPLLIALVELLRAGAWVLFLVRLVSRIGVSRALRVIAIVASAGFPLGVAIAVVWALSDPGVVINLGAILIPGGLVLALLGLVVASQPEQALAQRGQPAADTTMPVGIRQPPESQCLDHQGFGLGGPISGDQHDRQ